MDEPKRSWIDASINIQTLATGIVGAAISLSIAYFTLVQRVALIEVDVVHLKTEQKDRQEDTQRNLNEIKGSVQNTNDKLDKLTTFLLQNSAGQRSEMQRWSK